MRRFVILLTCMTFCLHAYCDDNSSMAPAICPEPLRAEISTTKYHPLLSISINCPDAESLPWAEKHLEQWYGKLAPKVFISNRNTKDLAEEEYELTIGKTVNISASTLQGVRYALYSLRQIAIPARGSLTVQNWIVPEAAIYDKPTLAFRGIHICWFHETKPWEVERLIRMAAYYKLNYAIVESWGTFRSDVAPWYGWPDGNMTKEEVSRLKAIADDMGITLIPQINVFGHATMARVSSGKHACLDLNPEYQSLFEPVAGWNWCLSNPEATNLLKALIVEQLEAFGNPPYFHIGCDEAEPPSCPECISKTYSELFLNHVKSMDETIKSKGARTMMWHDMLLEKGDPRWEGFYAKGSKATAAGLTSLPRDIIICDWYYDKVMDDYPTLDYFKGLGFMTLTCPWSFTEGIRAQGLRAKQGMADGILGTLWNHYYGKNLVNVYLALSTAAWNAGADSKANEHHFRTHLRQVGWDMNITDSRNSGLFYDEVPPEPHL